MNQNTSKPICFIFAMLFSFSFAMAYEKSMGTTQEGKEYTVTLGPTNNLFTMQIRVNYSASYSATGGAFLSGTIAVDGKEYDIYIPKDGSYALKNTDKVQVNTLLYSNALMVGVDYDGNGRINNTDEVWTADYPIRFGNKMLAVKSIAADGRTMVLVEVDIPVKGLVTGQRAPDFDFTDMDGKKHTLSDYKGKYLLIQVWAQSCGICIAKMPDVFALQRELGTDKLDVLCISMDHGIEGSEQRNRDILKKRDLPWSNVLVPNRWNGVVELFNVQGYGFWLIGPEGKVLVAKGSLEAIRAAMA